MPKVFFTLLVLFYALHSTGQNASANFNKLRWLVGEWNRTNIKPGRSGAERWISNSETELQGWGVTMKGNDTVVLEKLKLVLKDDQIFYVADVAENPKPVYFKLSTINEKSFVCENPEHDFPKSISYSREGRQMKAVISGNGKSMEYVFEKKE